jgi:hypothetical protein
MTRLSFLEPDPASWIHIATGLVVLLVVWRECRPRRHNENKKDKPSIVWLFVAWTFGIPPPSQGVPAKNHSGSGSPLSRIQHRQDMSTQRDACLNSRSRPQGARALHRFDDNRPHITIKQEKMINDSLARLGSSVSVIRATAALVQAAVLGPPPSPRSPSPID